MKIRNSDKHVKICPKYKKRTIAKLEMCKGCEYFLGTHKLSIPKSEKHKDHIICEHPRAIDFRRYMRGVMDSRTMKFAKNNVIP